MKLTVITVSYNSEKTIRDSIESVLSQTGCDIEYIIVDGQSTDGTCNIIRSYKDRITKFISEGDGGIYDAMNKGLNHAHGDVIGFLNSDDVYADSDVLAKVTNAFKESDCEAVYGDLVYVEQNNPLKIVRKWKSRPYKRQLFQSGWMPPHPTFYVRREVYERYGLFNTSLKNAADYEIMLRFLYKEQIRATYIPEVLVRMRVGGMSNANFLNRIKANKEDRQAWRINNLKPGFFTLWLKPIRKIPQFLFR